MKLDQKYFVPFLAVAAILTALLITFFTISSQKGQRQVFREFIMQQDTLRLEEMPLLNEEDSLAVSDLTGKYVILDFWATWSNFSEDVHFQISDMVKQHSDTLAVIAAVVEDRQEKIDSYIERHDFPFRYVDGTAVFNKYDIPGMPTEIVYRPDGSIMDVYFGYSDSTHFDSLRTLLNNGR
ncbi:MAG: TlpA disulfide reductase family protein [Balneolaceae bacterium]|nr:TlpA disulfide reductase family protein [Balneolaceae bacterium]